MSRNNSPNPEFDSLRILPCGWTWVSAGQISEIQGGIQKQPSRSPKNNAFPYLRVANVLRGRLDLSKICFLELFSGELEKLRLKKGDLLVVEGNGSKTEIGRSALWMGEIENCIHQNHIIRLRLLEGEPRFFDYYWNSSEGNKRVTDVAASTSGLYTLSIRKVSSVQIPLAPLPEQARIARKIEELFSKLDAGVAALERVMANLKRYRAAVLKAAVEGKLTAEWRAKQGDTEPASKLLERILKERRRKWEHAQLAKYAAADKEPPKGWREKYEEPSLPTGQEGQALPANWIWVCVDHLLTERTCNGISVKGSDSPPGVAALRLSAMSAAGFNYSERRYIQIDAAAASALSIREDDFFVSRGNGSLHLVGRGTLAQAPPTQVVFPDTMIRLRLSNWKPLRRYVSLVWQSRLVRRQIEKRARTTAGIYKISQRDIESFRLPLPALAEQQQIVAEVERRLSIVDELEAQVEADLKRAGRLRQSILKRAFAGRLVPQDPADEPAAKLLERVRNSRARQLENGERKTRAPAGRRKAGTMMKRAPADEGRRGRTPRAV